MVQALVTLLFASSGLLAVGLIVLLLRNDWAAVSHALGIAGRMDAPAPMPLHVRTATTRRAVMMRVEVPTERRAAA